MPSILDLISETVKLTREGAEYKGLCPFHPDRNPSLKVNLEKGLWKCHGCGAGGTIYDWLMRRDNITLAEAKARLNGQPEKRQIVATYDYTDETGKLLFQVVRYQPKGFSQRQPDGKGGWLANLKGVEPVLYNLPAIKTAEVVYVVEGEKDANRLIYEGVCATTGPMGAGHWRTSYAEALWGKVVVVMPDNDEPGQKHANQVAASLKGIVREVWICRLPGLSEHGDVSDWLDQGHTVAELREHWRACDGEPVLEIRGGTYAFSWGAYRLSLTRIREDNRHGQATAEIKMVRGTAILLQAKLNLLSPRGQAEAAKRLAEKDATQDWQPLLESICIRTLDALREGEPVIEISTTENVTPTRYLVHPLLVEGHVNFIFGVGGVSKSYLALIMSTIIYHAWQDNPFRWPVLNEPGKTLYLDWEMSRSETAKRFKYLKNGMGLPDASLAYRRCYHRVGDDAEALTELVAEHQPRLIVIDSLLGACGGDLNKDTSGISQFFNTLRSWNTTVLVLAHTSKEKSEPGQPKSIFGSAFFDYYGRNNWEARKTQEVGVKEIFVGLFHRKQNMSEQYPAIGLRFQFGEDFTVVNLTDLEATALSSNLPLQDQIKGVLYEGPMTLQEIADAVSVDSRVSQDTVRRILNRFRGKLFEKGEGGQWEIHY